MAISSTIRRVALTAAQQRGLAGTSVIGKRKLTVSERQVLAQRFGLGEEGRSFRTEAATASAFFAGGDAPYQGNIRDTRTGAVYSTASAKGKRLLASFQASLAAKAAEARAEVEAQARAKVEAKVVVEKTLPAPVVKPVPKLDIKAPVVTVSPMSFIDVKKTIVPEEAGFVMRWKPPAAPEELRAFEEGRRPAELYWSSERIEAATRAEVSKTIMLGMGLAIPIGGAGAYATSGLAGLATYGAELAGGYIAGEVVSKEAPPVLEYAFPGRPKETYKIAGEALGIAGFIIGAKGVGFGIKHLPGMGEVGAIGVVKKKPKLPKRPELGGYLKPVKKGYPDPLTIMPRGKHVKVTELGKYLDPARPLQYKEIMFVKSLRPIKPVKISPKIVPKVYYPDPLTVMPRGKYVKVPDLGIYLDPARKLQYSEKIFARVVALQKMKPFYKAPLIKTVPKVSPPTTAGLSASQQLEFKKFVEKVTIITKPFKKVQKTDFFSVSKFSPAEAIERSGIFREIRIGEARVAKLKRLAMIVKPPVVIKPIIYIPESYKALAVSLPKVYKPKPILITKDYDVVSVLEKLKPAVVSRPPAVLPQFKYSVPSKIQMAYWAGTAVAPVSVAKVKAISAVKEIAKEEEVIISIVKPVELPKEAEIIIPKEVEIIVPKIKQAEVQKQIERFVPRQIIKPKFWMYEIPKPVEYVRPKPIERILPKPFLFLPPQLFPGFRKPAKFEDFAGFFPIVRRAGKEVALTKFPVSKEAARAIAVSEVIASPRASFKLLAARGRPVKIAYPYLPPGVMKMFRPAKTLPGFMVEKTKYRIDQPGEFAGITAKGLEALASPFGRRKKKSKKKKSRGWLF